MMKIGNPHQGPGERLIDVDHPPYVIAEIGVNHDGSVERALELVDAAACAKVDAVKLQLFEARRLLGRTAGLAAYQRRGGERDPMQMLERLEIAPDELRVVVARAHEAGVHAIVSVFNVELVHAATPLAFDAFKTASTDIINRPLIESLMATGRPLIVSTGAASVEEIAEATRWLGDHPHLLMHCVSRYPTPDAEAALGGRIALMEISPRALGYSDHTTSLDTGALAVAGGACILEKHFTHDRRAPGPDHAASLEPDDLAEYVRLVHRAWRMRGPVTKRVAADEQEVRMTARQSLTATRDLPIDHVLGPADLTIKRPGTGLSPARLAEVEGRRLVRAIAADMPLTEEHLA